MKLYVLRHERRGSDASFYSPLLKEGLDNSEKLVTYLDNEKIDLIFSSPFKRTLQTVKPYCDKKNLKINVEFSLYEKMHKDFFNKNTYKMNIQENDDEYYLINKNYESFHKMENLIYHPKFNDIKNRTNKFVNHLINKYKNTNYNILLVSHATTVNSILYDCEKKYRMGLFTKFYDNDKFVNIPIN